MPPLKRLPENRRLPARWVQKHGAFYYLVPPGLEAGWDGKKWFRLGTTLAEAHAAFAARIKDKPVAKTIGQLLDRYAVEVVPKKAPKTASENLRQIARCSPRSRG